MQKRSLIKLLFPITFVPISLIAAYFLWMDIQRMRSVPKWKASVLLLESLQKDKASAEKALKDREPTMTSNQRFEEIREEAGRFTIMRATNGLLVGVDTVKHITIVLIPQNENGVISWSCYGIPLEKVPEACKAQNPDGTKK